MIALHPEVEDYWCHSSQASHIERNHIRLDHRFHSDVQLRLNRGLGAKSGVASFELAQETKCCAATSTNTIHATVNKNPTSTQSHSFPLTHLFRCNEQLLGSELNLESRH